MHSNPIKRWHAIPVVFSILMASCQKEIKFEMTGSLTEVDSSLLIKNIALYAADPTVQDSIVENYHYDTAARKITITWTDPGEVLVPDGTSADFFYDNNLQLVRVTYTYPASYVPGIGDIVNIDINYDAQKILSQTTTLYGDGTTRVRDYTKTVLSQGYQLDWDESDIASPDISLRSVVFDASGNARLNIQDRTFIAEYTQTGDPVYTQYVVVDSFFYDGDANMSGIRRTVTDTLRHTQENFLSFEFAGRATTGSALYNQRQALLKGIVHIPFGDGDSDGDGLGILGNGLDYDYLQYSKYPAQTINVYNWNTNDYTFNTASQYDSQNRLVSFKGCHLDLDIYGHIFKIRYFK